jgi:hypothetical protein
MAEDILSLRVRFSYVPEGGDGRAKDRECNTQPNMNAIVKSESLLNKGKRDPSSQKEWMTDILRLRGPRACLAKASHPSGMVEWLAEYYYGQMHARSWCIMYLVSLIADRSIVFGKA